MQDQGCGIRKIRLAEIATYYYRKNYDEENMDEDEESTLRSRNRRTELGHVYLSFLLELAKLFSLLFDRKPSIPNLLECRSDSSRGESRQPPLNTKNIRHKLR